MIRHAFKLMWNRKWRNTLLTVEILLSFLVLFAVASIAISSAVKYATPLGFSYENTWVLSPNRRGGGEQTEAQIRQTMQQVTMDISSYPEVRYLSWITGCLPYAGMSWASGYNWRDKEAGVHMLISDDNTAAVLEIPIAEGRWFGPEDDASSKTPIVITRQARSELFGEEPAIGSVLTQERDSSIAEYIIVGVADDFRYLGEFDQTYPMLFERTTVVDTFLAEHRDAIIAVQDGVGVNFEERLSERLASLAPGWNFRIQTMSGMRADYLRDELLPMVIMGAVAGFLILNVALGLFGVLWYSISRRRGEIGLRRAVGADGKSVSRQILGEALVLATFGIIVGSFLVIQVPILELETSIASSIYLIAMACTASMIYLIVSICALYPGRLASRIQPAEALHVD
jgi:putative ABC transport system permease protein